VVKVLCVRAGGQLVVPLAARHRVLLP
jgi:hypothetical protein